jgi:aldose 1-epimerase
MPPVRLADGGVADDECVTLVAGELRAEVLTYGAHLVGFWAPDRAGRLDNLVSSLRDERGAPDVARYADPIANPHLGSIVGRVANRIGDAAFELEGRRVELVPNEGRHQLHGGPVGIDRHVWTVIECHHDHDTATLTLSLTSPDGDQGYPGTVELVATYTLRPDGLSLHVDATSDRTTVLGVTHHGYWNLAGTSDVANAVDALGAHRLRVAADHVVVVDDELIPTGELRAVGDTPFDLREAVELVSLFDGPELAATGGIDHCLVLAPGPEREGPAAAELYDPGSGRRLELWTDQVGLQVYAANHGAGDLPAHGAVCLEAQPLPDSPNHPAFPDITLAPQQRRRWTLDLRCSTT